MKSILVVRRGPAGGENDIRLDEWLSYIEASTFLEGKPVVERQGINPFTKKPAVFKTAPGGAFFEGRGGRCEVEYHSGGLIVRGAVEDAREMVARIAEGLGAEVELVDEEG